MAARGGTLLRPQYVGMVLGRVHFGLKSYPHGAFFLRGQCCAAKDKPFKLSDGDGLYLLVQPHGIVVAVQIPLRRDESMLTLGAFPTSSRCRSREKREAAQEAASER